MKKEYREILEEIKSVYGFTDDELKVFDLILGTALSIKTERPNWVMIVAPPSSGKSQLLDLLKQIPNLHFLSNITPKFLFSGYENAKGGYIPREVKGSGVLVFQDFTTIMSLSSRERSVIFNQLRMIFDGQASLGTGITTKKVKHWQGRVAIITTVTESIEKIKEKLTDLGERFLYFNFNPTVKDNFLETNLDNKEKRIKSIQEKIRRLYFTSQKDLSKVELPAELKKHMFNCAGMIGWGRTSVDRNGYKRDIEFVHQREKPYRTYELLKNVTLSIIAINRDTERTKKVISQITASSIPKIRMQIIVRVLRSKKQVDLQILCKHIKVSTTKVRRTVEDLVVLDILKVEKIGKGNTQHFLYSFTKEFEELFRSVL